MNDKYYTVDELRQLGCPDGLIIQYIFMTKEWIYKETGLKLDE